VEREQIRGSEEIFRDDGRAGRGKNEKLFLFLKKRRHTTINKKYPSG
jgi:hypothetical protein